MNYKRWILITIFLFGISLFFGSLATPASTSDTLSRDIAAFKEFARILASFPPAITALIIFIKNTSILVMSFLLSPILCLVPILALTLNGWVIASISQIIIQEKSLGFLLAGLLPHGIFEIPALILGEAAALAFGATVILALFKKDRRNQLLPSLKQNLRYLTIAVTLFLPAAIVETFVTPLLLT